MNKVVCLFFQLVLIFFCLTVRANSLSADIVVGAQRFQLNDGRVYKVLYDEAGNEHKFELRSATEFNTNWARISFRSETLRKVSKILGYKGTLVALEVEKGSCVDDSTDKQECDIINSTSHNIWFWSENQKNWFHVGRNVVNIEVDNGVLLAYTVADYWSINRVNLGVDIKKEIKSEIWGFDGDPEQFIKDNMLVKGLPTVGRNMVLAFKKWSR